MKRRLRIAVSVFFALVAVAFAVLRVRSYRQLYMANSPVVASNEVRLGSVGGLWSIGIHSTGSQRAKWETFSHSISQPLATQIAYEPNFRFRANGLGVVVSYWLTVIITAGIIPLIWFPYSRRFSLRTLLIATTLVAVVLGLGVWASR